MVTVGEEVPLLVPDYDTGRLNAERPLPALRNAISGALPDWTGRQAGPDRSDGSFVNGTMRARPGNRGRCSQTRDRRGLKTTERGRRAQASSGSR